MWDFHGNLKALEVKRNYKFSFLTYIVPKLVLGSEQDQILFAIQNCSFYTMCRCNNNELET